MTFEDDEINEEDVKFPISMLVLGSKKPVEIIDMADYADIFFAIENTVLHFVSESDTNVIDQDVLKAYNYLLKDFDNHKEDTLESEISKSIKAFLIMRKKNGERGYTYGEIISCVKFLIKIANDHKSPDGLGYIRWVKTFLEGNMPKSIDEIVEYIFQNEC